MRMNSCSGCRVLRKGCGERCAIRPCLDWIESPTAQAHATLFLAKFYGRAGLLNLLAAGAPHIRPAIFRSLLYEACGRMVNPVHGVAGLASSGRWHLCQEAVEAVLRTGRPLSYGLGRSKPTPGSAHKALIYDIRHVSGKPSTSQRRRLSPLVSTFDQQQKEEKAQTRSEESCVKREYGAENQHRQEDVELELTLGWPISLLSDNGSSESSCLS